MISPKALAERNVPLCTFEMFDVITFHPAELIELRNMDRETLLQLMYVLGIRQIQETPVSSCSDDELRMGYCILRSGKMQDAKMKWSKRWRAVFHTIVGMYDIYTGEAHL